MEIIDVGVGLTWVLYSYLTHAHTLTLVSSNYSYYIPYSLACFWSLRWDMCVTGTKDVGIRLNSPTIRLFGERCIDIFELWFFISIPFMLSSFICFLCAHFELSYVWSFNLVKQELKRVLKHRGKIMPPPPQTASDVKSITYIWKLLQEKLLTLRAN